MVSVETWVEGIGSDGGLFGIYNSLPEILTTTNADFYQFTYGKWGEMDSCYENSKYVFTNDNYHKNGITEGFVGIVFVRNVEREVYDLQGRRVLTPQLGGLYIQGGKKFIFR